MANVFFDNPPILNGKNEQQLQQLYSYLSIMSDKLNQALMSISIEQMAEGPREAIISAANSQQTIAANTESLKSLIIKTADVVRSEMEEIRADLHGEYVAVSDQFGTYVQELDQTIKATAEGVLQQFQVIERINGLEADNEDFLSKFSSYIYMGELDPITHETGIAVGDGLSYSQSGGIENKMATFTKDRLSFWQGNVEVAYFSNQVFVIDNGEVRRTMRMGNHIWQVLADGSIALISDQQGV